ncbi:MAG: NAD(P)H-dependent glycerol-3-phosphate dehydrogenase [Bacteroidetes bacterium]|jgi:glycerol-3-phosphate dehydrogenase (NAD(P)+)|nr:NAD(P)H-dependent glycerol-3-phosphate dehydrogenase [Bacteroidota bacterium]
MADHYPPGVIGAGSFGMTIAMLLSKQQDVIVYVRSAEQAKEINQKHKLRGITLSDSIRATSNIPQFCESVRLIFPAVPSKNFSDMIAEFSSCLRPYHLMIHCTKGFDVRKADLSKANQGENSTPKIRTISEVILEETVIRRVGCLAGPNLAREIQEGFPTASVIASPYDELIEMGQQALNSESFFVFGSHDMRGAELAGALKNIIALGTGMLDGRLMGKNIQAMLITRGLREMIYLGKAMGSDSRAFLGTAGIGDLIATATSSKSRNYTVGFRMGQGEHLDAILSDMDEVAEGVRTLQIAKDLAEKYAVQVPIISVLHKVVFEGFDIGRAIHYLMRYPFAPDVDFL